MHAGCDTVLVCSGHEIASRVREALIHRAEKDARFPGVLRGAAARSLAARRRFRARAPEAGRDIEAALAELDPAKIERRLAAESARSC